MRIPNDKAIENFKACEFSQGIKLFFLGNGKDSKLIELVFRIYSNEDPFRSQFNFFYVESISQENQNTLKAKNLPSLFVIIGKKLDPDFEIYEKNQISSYDLTHILNQV